MTWCQNGSETSTSPSYTGFDRELTGNIPQEPGAETDVCPAKDSIYNNAIYNSIVNISPDFESAHCKNSPT